MNLLLEETGADSREPDAGSAAKWLHLLREIFKLGIGRLQISRGPGTKILAQI